MVLLLQEALGSLGDQVVLAELEVQEDLVGLEDLEDLEDLEGLEM